MDQHPARHAEFPAAHARPRRGRNKTTDTQAIGWSGISRHRTGFRRAPKGEKLDDGNQADQRERPVYRGPGAPATRNGAPLHVRDLRLDTKLDVPQRLTRRDAHERDEGRSGAHSRQAVYVGLFRAPELTACRRGWHLLIC